MYPSGKEPLENLLKEGGFLKIKKKAWKVDWTDLLSITFKADESDILLPGEPAVQS